MTIDIAELRRLHAGEHKSWLYGAFFQERTDFIAAMRNALPELLDAYEELGRAKARIVELESALAEAEQALVDWLHIYAPDMCDEARVREANQRTQGGMLLYVGGAINRARAALKGGPL